MSLLSFKVCYLLHGHKNTTNISLQCIHFDTTEMKIFRSRKTKKLTILLGNSCFHKTLESHPPKVDCYPADCNEREKDLKPYVVSGK